MDDVQQLAYPGSRIKCRVRSATESGRARKIKETWTASWAAELPAGAVFYDIGANIGIMSLLAAEDRAKQVRVVAFEPAVTNFPSLVENIAMNDLSSAIMPFQVGLGETTRVDYFNYQNLDPGGSLHSFGSIIPFKPSRSVEPVRSIPMLCYALDDFVRLDGVPFPTHIKIDVDGTELRVLQGASAVLSDARLHEVQVETVDFSEAHETSSSVVELMAKHGLTQFDTFLHNKTYPLCRDYRFRRA
jgi:FkbM family methyltransferase